MSQEEDSLLETRHGKSGTDHDGSKAKRAATQFFMNNAPSGALREVMENCELLVDPSAVSNRFMEDALEQAAENQYQIVTVVSGQGSHQAVLCSAGRLDKSTYLCPSTKEVLSVTANGSDLKVSASPASTEVFACELEPYREALETELTNYVKQRYSCNTLRLALRVPVDMAQAVCVFSYHQSDATPVSRLTAVMSTAAENTVSCWACSWTSEWRIFFSASDPSSDARIEGDVHVRCYLHEDCSLQANFSRHFGLQQAGANSADEVAKNGFSRSNLGSSSDDICLVPGTHVGVPGKFVPELVKAIRANEEILTQEIDAFFTNRALRVARGIRRVLPVYGKAFDWKQQSLQLRPQQLSTEQS